MAHVECEVSAGLRGSEKKVTVRTAGGGKEFLRVEEDFLHRDNGKYYLPVGLVDYNATTNSVLIELPYEADSGANRLWVPRASLLEPSEAVA